MDTGAAVEVKRNEASLLAQGGGMNGQDDVIGVKEDDGRQKHRKLVSISRTSPDPETYARSYQLEALEKARNENTIAFLETGSGKTLIAIMLLRTYAHQLRKPSPSIAVFLVPTVVLVMQQAQSLEMHTDLKIRKLYGDLGVDFWNATAWKEELEKYEVFVMTPQILLDNLRHCLFKLEMIKLLIFDECHHASGRHPYACIMTEFYHRRLRFNSSLLPRIFGMTASPLNSKADELRNLKLKHLQALQKLQLNENAEESTRKRIAKLHSTFVFCLTELGVWLTLTAAQSLSSSATEIFFWGEKKDGLGETIVRNFSQDVFEVFLQYLPSGPEWSIGQDLRADLEFGLLTSKVNCLIESLLEYRSEELRCIIFVERVITAIVLQSLLSQVPQLSCCRTAYMAGSHAGLQAQTRSEHIKIVDKFREGTVNMIVATQILEEGLDVQSCNLVIRFDPPATVCSFIQSRGRARMRGSDYILLVQSGDRSTLSSVMNYLNCEDIMREESLRQANLQCSPLETGMINEDFYCVEATGAIVTLSSSVQLIYFYCSKLPSDGYFTPTPMFHIKKESGLCILHLPKSCPLQLVHVEGQHDMLKQIACLEACKRLHKIGALTDYLLPESDIEERDDSQQCGMNSCEDQQPDYFPGELVDFWSSFSGTELYHCYSFSLKQNFNYDVPLRDIVLIVKCDLGTDFASTVFQLQVGSGAVSVSMRYAGPIHVGVEQVLMARRFQVSILRMLIDHNMSRLKDALDELLQETSLATTSYLLLPSNSSNIDWVCVRSALFLSKAVGSNAVNGDDGVRLCSCPEQVCRMMQTKDCSIFSCMLRNSIVFTPHNGHIYCITSVLDDLNGDSLMKLSKKVLTYKEYYQSQHGVSLFYARESLLCGRHLFTVHNWLQRRTLRKDKELSKATVELPPELCVVLMSPITVGTLYSFSFVPSLMHRIESMLLALRLKKMQMNHCTQNVFIPTTKVLEAITTKKCQEEFSLESLETLGDSFIKYTASQQLFRNNKHHHEGLLSTKKERMISNAALYKLGCKRQLQGFIRNLCFDPKLWVIPGELSGCFLEDLMFCSTPKLIYRRGTRHMKSKVVADVVEALIGAYLSEGGEWAALAFMDWLGMKIDFVNEIPGKRPSVRKPEAFIKISYLESLLKYSFRDPSLLVEALTHGSYQIPDIPMCYQRLEFLGDSVLDYLVTVYFYNKYPGLSPGLLTDLRSASVNNDCYALAAVKAGLHKCILHASSILHKQITLFVNNFGQSFSGSSFGWESEIAIPKVLGDIIESIAGAILIDSDFDKEIVWESIRPLLEPLVTPNTIKYQPVRELDLICQKKSYVMRFIKTCIDGCAAMTAEVEADGVLFKKTCTAANKKTAKKLAAKAVIDSLKACIPGL